MMKAEFSMYGLDPFATDETERPIYGYMDIGGRNDTFDGVLSNSLNGYGQIRVEFKDSVRDRTTVSFGDSLGEAYIPAPLNKVHVDAVVKSSKQDIDRPWRTSEYVEAQIHGGVTADDIERVSSLFTSLASGVAGTAERCARSARRAWDPSGWHRR